MWRKPLPSFLFKSLCPSLCSCECEGIFLHIYWCLVIVGAPPFYIQGALLLPGIVCSTLTRFPKKMPALKVYIFNLFYSFIITKDFLINKKTDILFRPLCICALSRCLSCLYLWLSCLCVQSVVASGVLFQRYNIREYRLPHTPC